MDSSQQAEAHTVPGVPHARQGVDEQQGGAAVLTTPAGPALPPPAPATIGAPAPVTAPVVTQQVTAQPQVRAGQAWVVDTTVMSDVTQPIPVQRPAPAAPRRPNPVLATASALARRMTAEQAVSGTLAVVLVALSLLRPWPVVVLAVLVGAALVASTTVRVGERWLYQVIGTGARYLTRSHTADLPAGEGTGIALLRVLHPGATTRTEITVVGPTAVIDEPRGLTAIVRPRAVTAELIRSLPTPEALLPADSAAEAAGEEIGVQLVCHAGRVPRLWLTVHVPRAPGEDESVMALHNAVRRVNRALERNGVVVDPLTEPAALSALTSLAHVTGGRTALREQWTSWHTGSITQACFRLDGWQRLSQERARALRAELLDRAPSGVAVTLTTHASPGSGAPGALVRLAAPGPDPVAVAATELAAVLSTDGIGVTRLDGSHLRGVAASLPIGGFPQ